MSNPDFIIAGERRSGSTTLYEILKQHPEVGMFHKSDFDYFIEPELFSKKEDQASEVKKWDETHSKEEYQSLFKNLKGKVGQKDADLLWWRSSHKRLAEYLPNTKFLFVLRNPTSRAESQYWNEVGKGRETFSFADALQRENTQELSNWQQLHIQYKERGVYFKSLENFFKYIPKNRVHIVILEELFKDWNKEMNSICEFLDIDSKIGQTLKPIHSNKENVWVRKSFANGTPLKYIVNFWERLTEGLIVRITQQKDKRASLRKKLRGFYLESKRENKTIDHSIKEQLNEFYKPTNAELEKLLGRKINVWTK